MTLSALEKTDFSAPLPAKAETRRDNLLAVKSSGVLWSHRKKRLHVDWLELAGMGAPTFQYLLDQEALGERIFVGVDRDPDVLESCRLRYQDHKNAEWVRQENVTHFLVSGDRRLDRVGVLNFDSFRASGNGLDRELDDLFLFARTQFERLGAFFLVLNLSQKIRSDSILEQARWIAETLSRRTQAVWSAQDILDRKYRSKEVWMFNIHVKFGF